MKGNVVMGSMDFTGLAYLAVIGAIAVFLAVVFGLPMIVFWLFEHVRIV
jgi:hypothetical protein